MNAVDEDNLWIYIFCVDDVVGNRRVLEREGSLYTRGCLLMNDFWGSDDVRIHLVGIHLFSPSLSSSECPASQILGTLGGCVKKKDQIAFIIGFLSHVSILSSFDWVNCASIQALIISSGRMTVPAAVMSRLILFHQSQYQPKPAAT